MEQPDDNDNVNVPIEQVVKKQDDIKSPEIDHALDPAAVNILFSESSDWGIKRQSVRYSCQMIQLW